MSLANSPRHWLRIALIACFCLGATFARGAEAAKRLNVLFIVADDLRPELGCYGSPAISPHIDRLAERGVLFHRAYCQQALCNPSRSSMLTGLRPNTLRLWANGTHFRELRPDVVTLPQWFKEQGYVTRDVGKIFHNWHTQEHGDRHSWSAPEFLHYENHGNDKPIVDGPASKSLATAPKCERCDVPDEAYFDGRVADEAVRVLTEIRGEPFFLAVGFWKPHAPFNAPSRYWEASPKDLVPKLEPRRPTGAPEIAFHDGRELRGLPPNQIDFSHDEIAEIRHGYFANVAYMDAQVGKVLAALESQGLADSTVVVFCGDHGYHLGEHDLWAKTSCFELDARVPLIIAPPRCLQAGAKSDAMVELLDLFPTLVELCGLPSPPKPLEGKSLSPVLKDVAASVKPAAFTQHPRPAYYDRTETGVPEAMGYSVRTPKVRYTEWRDWATGKTIARELYDHTSDPQELNNIVESASAAKEFQEATAFLAQAHPPRAGVPDETTPLELLKKSKRVLFLGDSITAAGQYVASFEAWLASVRWEQTPEVIDAGLSSETVSGLSEEGHAGGKFPRPDLHERLDRVLSIAKPDLVIACYGINCGIYEPFDESRFAKYQSGMRRLKEKVEGAGASLVVMTPPFYDDQRAPKPFSYNEILDRYSDWLVSQRTAGWRVIDLHGPMTEEVRKRRMTDPQFTFQPDGVHPNDAGHWKVAQQVIRWFGDEAAAAAATPEQMLTDRKAPAELLPLVRQRVQVLRDAYVSAAGHKRPGVAPGLSLEEARKKANQLTEKIQATLESN